MFQLILLLLIPFLLAFLYSYLISRYSKNKILLFLPAILGGGWFLYLFTVYNPEESVGLAGIAVIIYALSVLGVILGNTIASLYFIFNKSKGNKA